MTKIVERCETYGNGDQPLGYSMIIRFPYCNGYHGPRRKTWIGAFVAAAKFMIQRKALCLRRGR